MNYQTENNRFDWQGQSILIKLLLIGALTLVLLIPSNWIQELILERQNRQDEVIQEISDKWAGNQLLQGPAMILPYKTLIGQKDTTGRTIYKESLTNIYLLPEKLDIISKVIPEKLHRGIFDAVVYNTRITVNGKFNSLELKKSGINPGMVQWDKAKLAIGLSDLKGLKNNPSITFNDSSYNVEPGFDNSHLFSNNLIVQPDLSVKKNTEANFSFTLDMRGSGELNFMHLGRTTTVKVDGKWDNPSFTGRYLPEDRQVSEDFNAVWKMPYFSRPYPQQWIEQNAIIKSTNNDATFGVKFLLPVDQYQKTMRSAKYAILIILLTFISLFFTELLNKKKVHLLQYILIGAAMTIYYTLLLSFSERVGFTIAYLIASVATVALIGIFIASLLKNKKPALVFSAILSVFYSFIFVLIQLQDMALLFGSIGLFITVAAMMYLSAKMDWNRQPEPEPAL